MSASWWRTLPLLLATLQALAGLRVIARMARTARGTVVQPVAEPMASAPVGERVSVIVPVLNEATRLVPCLDGLRAQGREVAEILVVDGGSTDGTQALVQTQATLDPRIRLLDASPVAAGWNGKCWNLDAGIARARAPWVLTIDADVRPAPGLAAALLAHACREQTPVLSVAARQELATAGIGLLHPAMLTTLVYRFGIPGRRYRRVHEVQASGQCMLARRELLTAAGGFATVRDEIAEDVTLARLLVERGVAVGFYEAGDLVRVRMYESAGEAWRGWLRSLPLRDRYWGPRSLAGLAEVLLAQALPLALLLLPTRLPRPARLVNVILLLTRLGVLAGTARAYPIRPWSYWCSPLADLPVAIGLVASALRREHTWRGRVVVRGGGSSEGQGWGWE